ncbi:MAG: serine hydrolase [Phycisphaerae bacterium]|nr:serine hydrolase [Phycisphaerae bacterium]
MNNKTRNLTMMLLLGLLISSAASAAQLKPLMDWMNSLVESGKVVGCMVQVTRDGETIFLEAVGDRTPGSEEDLETDQVIRIYSMSKAVTSTAIMQLVEQGKLDLDDPVSKYIPEFKETKVSVDGQLVAPRRPVTIRDLLTHTSGLAYDFSAPPELVPHYKDKMADVTSLEETAVVMSRMPLASHPGQAFVYGLNTDVLGRVVEVVSGKEFEVYLQENIFTPLGMDDTGFTPDADIELMHIVTPDEGSLVVDANHYEGGTKILKPAFQSGGGGLWSTIGDYTRFCRAMEQLGELDGNRILETRTVTFMTQNQLGPGTKKGPRQRFGLGFGIQPAVDSRMGPLGEGRWSWGGAACTYFFIDPEQDLTAVFATQQFPFNMDMNNEFHQVVLESMAIEESSR